MKVELTVWERAIGMLAENLAPVEGRDGLRVSLDVIDRLKFSEQERERYGVSEADRGLDISKSHENDATQVEFTDLEWARWKESIRKFENAPDRWPRDRRLLAFFDKINDLKKAPAKEVEDADKH